MCRHPGFVVPFTEHRQNRYSIVLKGPRIFRMVNELWLQFKVTRSLASYKRVRLTFEVLKPGIDLLSSYENPGWHLFFYFENLLFSVVTFISYLLPFSCSVVSNSLQFHGLQHTRLPCLLPSPGACSNSCPLSW